MPRGHFGAFPVNPEGRVQDARLEGQKCAGCAGEIGTDSCTALNFRAVSPWPRRFAKQPFFVSFGSRGIAFELLLRDVPEDAIRPPAIRLQ